MKIKLKSDWVDFGQLHKAGTVVDVGDDTGATLILEGHTRMPDATPARINPDLYTVGCHPTPFTNDAQATYAGLAFDIALSEPQNEGTRTLKHAKKE